MITYSNNHTTIMSGLLSQHSILIDLIDDNPLHFVDLPVHGNIGDLLIMHGTLAFFERYSLQPRISAPAFSYNPDWIRKGEVVVFHGGGNFGDLYSEYGMQPLREQVVASHPDNRIIILPQTIYFSSQAEQQRSASIFRQHRDVHICVRDIASYQIALEFSDKVYLLPDMAHQLYPIEPDQNVDASGTLRISRTDGEKSASAVSGLPDVAATVDWPGLVGSNERYINYFRRAMSIMHKYGVGKLGNQLMCGLWESYSESLIDNAVALYSSYQLIISDRLHGHILACLMDKPNVVIDNSYGKNLNYVNVWTADSDLVSLQRI